MEIWAHAYSAIDYLSVGILLTAIAINALRRLESCIRAYTLNSWLLSVLIGVIGLIEGAPHLYFASSLTFLSKGIVIPLLLRNMLKKMRVTHEVEPYIGNWLSLAISGILVVIVYTSLREGVLVTGSSKNVFQISIAVIFIGLFIMITRKKAITQVIGLLFMENGLFLAGFSFTFGMPIIIELGVLFDLLMGIIILGVFAVQIRKLFSSADLDRLTILKG